MTTETRMTTETGERRRDVLAHLRTHRGHVIHVVDPFKIEVAEAVEKAGAVAEAGMPALLLASTDYEDFEAVMPAYVDAVRAVTGIPTILHFPPIPGRGFPVVEEADSVMLPALLGSDDPYYVWKSLLETYDLGNGSGSAQPLLSAALTFGRDDRSYARMGTRPVGQDEESVARYADCTRQFGFDLAYLYSRNERVNPRSCEIFRARMAPEQLLFVSGGVRSPEQVDAYLQAGADYVIFAGALETPDWRAALARLCSAQRLQRREPILL
ncbi:geranylgeranylglyceryl/heptaprenylglyceryl phosphate synthase [Actinoplanes subtropicus]|uniref:geranylgeranylglyceryl/heptaprenylglyceryl phosphate synthase n=1 Tax=Actinoplanes subtropicus TaxID=543632 RepID=UPI0007C4702C|nr:geranylgeranylglyceryl/heptaprenylglyceryl phosphate synthase [Actinoplanes subtropicus]